MSDAPSISQLGDQSQKLTDANTNCGTVTVDSFSSRARQFNEKLLDSLAENQVIIENKCKNTLISIEQN